MPKPGEHKTVQARILQYAQDIGWRYVPRAEAAKQSPDMMRLDVIASAEGAKQSPS